MTSFTFTSIERSAAVRSWRPSFIRTLGYSTDADIIEEFFSTRQSQDSNPIKTLRSYVGKILAEDVINQGRLALSSEKQSEKLTTAMLKRMLDAGVAVVRIAEDADETEPLSSRCLRKIRPKLILGFAGQVGHELAARLVDDHHLAVSRPVGTNNADDLRVFVASRGDGCRFVARAPLRPPLPSPPAVCRETS